MQVGVAAESEAIVRHGQRAGKGRCRRKLGKAMQGAHHDSQIITFILWERL